MTNFIRGESVYHRKLSTRPYSAYTFVSKYDYTYSIVFQKDSNEESGMRLYFIKTSELVDDATVQLEIKARNLKEIQGKINKHTSIVKMLQKQYDKLEES